MTNKAPVPGTTRSCPMAPNPPSDSMAMAARAVPPVHSEGVSSPEAAVMHPGPPPVGELPSLPTQPTNSPDTEFNSWMR